MSTTKASLSERRDLLAGALRSLLSDPPARLEGRVNDAVVEVLKSAIETLDGIRPSIKRLARRVRANESLSHFHRELLLSDIARIPFANQDTCDKIFARLYTFGNSKKAPEPTPPKHTADTVVLGGVKLARPRIKASEPEEDDDADD